MTRNPRTIKVKVRPAVPPRPPATASRNASRPPELATAIAGRTARVMDPTVAAVLAVAVHVVVFVAAFLLEPEASNSQVAWEWVGDVAAFGYLIAMGTAFATLRGGRRSLKASLVAGSIGLFVVVGCPVSGHHEFAGWWYATLALFSVAALVPGLLLRHTGRPRRHRAG